MPPWPGQSVHTLCLPLAQPGSLSQFSSLSALLFPSQKLRNFQLFFLNQPGCAGCCEATTDSSASTAIHGPCCRHSLSWSGIFLNLSGGTSQLVQPQSVQLGSPFKKKTCHSVVRMQLADRPSYLLFQTLSWGHTLPSRAQPVTEYSGIAISTHTGLLMQPFSRNPLGWQRLCPPPFSILLHPHTPILCSILPHCILQALPLSSPLPPWTFNLIPRAKMEQSPFSPDHLALASYPSQEPSAS